MYVTTRGRAKKTVKTSKSLDAVLFGCASEDEAGEPDECSEVVDEGFG